MMDSLENALLQQAPWKNLPRRYTLPSRKYSKE